MAEIRFDVIFVGGPRDGETDTVITRDINKDPHVSDVDGHYQLSENNGDRYPLHVKWVPGGSKAGR